MGYHRAGFDILGVDNKPQKNYPFPFVQFDAVAFLRDGLWPADVEAIHISPPCQRWSSMSTCRPELAATYPDLITPMRPLLIATGLPYVIENVPNAPLLNPIMLCGQMFGLELYRHRLFESNVALTAPAHPKHVMPASKAGHWKPGTIMSISGHIAPIAHAREIMGIDWTNREELAEAIPPLYTRHVGKQLMKHLKGKP